MISCKDQRRPWLWPDKDDHWAELELGRTGRRWWRFPSLPIHSNQTSTSMINFSSTQNQGKAFRLRQSISDRGHRKEPRAVIGDPSVAEVLRWRWMTWRNYRPATNRKGGEMHAELEWSRLHVLCCPCSRSSWRACVSHGRTEAVQQPS